MTSKSAAEEIIIEFVSSEEFRENLHVFVVGGTAKPGNVLDVARQFLNSPLGQKTYSDFWNAPSLRGPEVTIEDPSAAADEVHLVHDLEPPSWEVRARNEEWAKTQPWYKGPVPQGEE